MANSLSANKRDFVNFTPSSDSAGSQLCNYQLCDSQQQLAVTKHKDCKAVQCHSLNVITLSLIS